MPARRRKTRRRPTHTRARAFSPQNGITSPYNIGSEAEIKRARRGWQMAGGGEKGARVPPRRFLSRRRAGIIRRCYICFSDACRPSLLFFLSLSPSPPAIYSPYCEVFSARPSELISRVREECIPLAEIHRTDIFNFFGVITCRYGRAKGL